MTHLSPKRNTVPKAVLLRSDLVSLTTPRPVNTAQPKTTVNSARPMINIFNKAHSTVRRPIDNKTTTKNSNFNQRVNTVSSKNVNTARPKAVVNNARPKAVLNAVKGNQVNVVKASAYWVWKPKTKGTCPILLTLKKLIGDMLPLEVTPKEGKSQAELTDESHILLKVSRKNNMYSVDLKNIVPKGGQTCLFAKATSDESKLWHRRLGHINFKTMNKLVKGNLARGLPLKLFKIDQTYVACQKGKQHRASSRTPQQNGVAERKNRTLIEADRTMLADSKLPTTFWAEAVNTACYVQNRIEAIQDELLQFKFQKVWTLVDLPNGKRAIGTKWVYRNKKDERGIVIKNKARLVAQGYTQEEGIDYDKIEEEVYVCQPLGFEDPNFPDRVYKVEKALYRLHQAPRAWYETLSTYLLDNGFQRGKIDKTLFIRRDKGDILLVQVYVDDIIFGSTKNLLCTEFEKMMHKRFQMSSMGELTFFLGLQVKQKEDGIFISQDKYVTEILKKFGFTNVKTASTPMETQKPLLKDEYGEEADVHLYRSMIGSLMYLTSSRPDIILIAWPCKKQTVVANSTIEAEYVAASSCCGQMLWIQNQLLDYGYNLMLTKDSNEKKLIQMIKIHSDKNVADLLTKAFDVCRFQYLIASIGMLNL
ncbi:putative ribonuclease H-like domain-containing protein [Tanacetum coccineum]